MSLSVFRFLIKRPGKFWSSSVLSLLPSACFHSHLPHPPWPHITCCRIIISDFATPAGHTEYQLQCCYKHNQHTCTPWHRRTGVVWMVFPMWRALVLEWQRIESEDVGLCRMSCCSEVIRNGAIPCGHDVKHTPVKIMVGQIAGDFVAIRRTTPLHCFIPRQFVTSLGDGV